MHILEMLIEDLQKEYAHIDFYIIPYYDRNNGKYDFTEEQLCIRDATTRKTLMLIELENDTNILISVWYMDYQVLTFDLNDPESIGKIHDNIREVLDKI